LPKYWVRRALNDADPPVYKRKAPPLQRILGPVKHIIDTYLEEDEKRPKSSAILQEGSIID